MSDFDSLFSATEQKYNLPPGILRATAQVESHFNPRAVSPRGAQSLMQIMPATAKSLGVDPFNVPQAIDGAGRLWQQNLQVTGGDIDKAAMMYHGGTDPKNWGPKTQAYPGKIAAALGNEGPQASHGAHAGFDPSDPIEAALAGAPSHTPPQPTTDPFEAALMHGTTGDGDHAFDPGILPASDRAQGGGRGSGAADAAAGRNMVAGASGFPAGDGGSQAGGPRAGLQPHQIGFVPGAIDSFLTGATADLVHPITAGLNAVIPLDKLTNSHVKSIWDGSSLSDAYHNNLAIERGNIDQFRRERPGTAFGFDMAGAIASPLNKVFAPAEGASFLRSVPNFMAQGALYGGLRGGSESGTVAGTMEGAGLGAALGPAGALVGNTVGKVLGAVLRARSTLASAIPQSERAAVADMINRGAATDQIIAEHPNLDPAYVEKWVQYRARGGKEPVNFKSDVPAQDTTAPQDAPAAQPSSPPTPQQYGAALGSQGSRRGVEAVSDLPPQVQADVQRLRQAGVAPAEAQAEADIRYVGGQPTVANVTRAPAEQRAMFEGAKMDTPEGAALADTIASNNQALHNTVVRTVDDLGGVPAQGEAAQTAAETLAKASDAGKANVNNLYAAARAQDGDVRINTDELRELLQAPELATPTNPQVKQLADGVRSYLQSVDQRAGTTLRTPEEMEQIRQLANSAYDPMGGQVNNAVRQIGKALDDGLDQLDQASASWKAARAAHRQWAQQYADPAGVAKLIARDANGNFLNADQWRLSENGLIDRLNDKPFAQVVGQLKAIGATDALNRLKAGIVQRAYERSTNSARDQLGNPVLNGKLFQNELNKIGMPKLQALFAPQEIAHLATIGRAARAMNEAVPGTVNTSGTSSSLINALKASPKAKTKLSTKLLAHGLATLGSPGLGNVAVELGGHGADALSQRGAKAAVNQGIREQLNPALARAMASRSSRRIENAQYRQMMGRMLRNRSSAMGGSAEDNRRAATGR